MPRFQPDASWRGRRRTVSVVQVEDLIRELPGVIDCRVVINRRGGVEEIHVLADATRPARAYSRDVQSALAARWQLLVDHRKISVARLRDVPPADKQVRLRVARVGLRQDARLGRVEVEVELRPAPLRDRLGREYDDPDLPPGPFTGRVAGSGNQASLHRLGARAAVEAVNGCLRPGHWMEVLACERHALGGCEVATALVLYRNRRQEERLLVGSALVHEGDGLDAGVRAGLAATNRVVARQMRRVVEPVEEETKEVGSREAVEAAIAEARAREREELEEERRREEEARQAMARRETEVAPGEWRGEAGPIRRVPKGRRPVPWPEEWSERAEREDAGRDAPRVARRWPGEAGPGEAAPGREAAGGTGEAIEDGSSGEGS
ncbi:MAG: hypothetical protein IRZ11_00135 [Clostridia bacterium]|nr:hypothetical protein [Clostridia bacterium]